MAALDKRSVAIKLATEAHIKQQPKNIVVRHELEVFGGNVASACARRSRGSEQITLRREFTSVFRTDARKELGVMAFSFDR